MVLMCMALSILLILSHYNLTMGLVPSCVIYQISKLFFVAGLSAYFASKVIVAREFTCRQRMKHRLILCSRSINTRFDFLSVIYLFISFFIFLIISIQMHTSSFYKKSTS